MSPKSRSTSAPVSASVASASAERLSQVAGHIVGGQEGASASSSKRGRRSKGSRPAGPPADYSDVLSNLQKLSQIAHTPDLTNRGYIRQKRDGKLWVRERLELLVDKGSFRELGSASGRVEWKQIGPRDEEPASFQPTNNLQGESVQELAIGVGTYTVYQGSDYWEVGKLSLRPTITRLELAMQMEPFLTRP